MITFSELGQYGRLGNQLWQFASTLGIGLKIGAGVVFRPWIYSKYFLHPYPPSEFSWGEFKVYNEPFTGYVDVYLDLKYNWNLKGYFQSYKYFENSPDAVRYRFMPNFATDIVEGDVAIHVRRGDYVSLSHIHPNLTPEYYSQAMELFQGATFVVYSDDIEWCKANLTGKLIFKEPKEDIYDLMSMAEYPNQIIANSSFSWWAAWLNTNPNKIVVAPKIWVNGETFDDRVPPEWVRI